MNATTPTPHVHEPCHVYRLYPRHVPLGHLVATPGALAAAGEHGVDVLALVRRHQSGDWGDVSTDDAQANDLGLDPSLAARLLSAYDTAAGRLWIITEADRSATTVLLPSEY